MYRWVLSFAITEIFLVSEFSSDVHSVARPEIPFPCIWSFWILFFSNQCRWIKDWEIDSSHERKNLDLFPQSSFFRKCTSAVLAVMVLSRAQEKQKICSADSFAVTMLHGKLGHYGIDVNIPCYTLTCCKKFKHLWMRVLCDVIVTWVSFVYLCEWDCCVVDIAALWADVVRPCV